MAYIIVRAKEKTCIADLSLWQLQLKDNASVRPLPNTTEQILYQISMNHFCVFTKNVFRYLTKSATR